MARKSTNNDKSAERPEKVGERVAKVIARAGFGSRREGEEMIAAGRVAINGTVIDTPAINVTPGDKVTIDGKPLPEPERTRLFLYHKTRGLVTSHNDPEGRPTVFAALPKHLPRLLSVGRLDFNTEGLLLLTNDGGLARILELPDTGWLRRYRVRAHGEVMQPQLDELRNGVTIEGMHYGPIEATLDRVQGSNVWITIGIREGKNREVRNILSHLGLQVTRLIRVSFGPFQLGDVPEGEVEEIKTRVLQEQLGEKVAKQAGVDFEGPIVERDEAPRRGRHGAARVESWPDHPVGRDRGRDEQPLRREGRSDRRDERPARGRDDRGPRDDRRGGDDRRPRGRERDEGRPGQDEGTQFSPPETRKMRPTSGHVWRQEGLERPKRTGAFRGPRREDGTVERPAPTGEKTAGLIADRKGRRVLVERFASAEPAPDEKVRIPKEPKRFGKGMRREHPAEAWKERSSGPPRERSRGAPGRPPSGPRRERPEEGRGERAFGPRRERSEGGRGERPSGPPRERSAGPKREWSPRSERSDASGKRPFGAKRDEGARGEKRFGGRRDRSDGPPGEKRFGGKRPFGDKRERTSGPPRDRASGPKRDWSSGPRGERSSGPRSERPSGPGRGRPPGPRGERPSGPRPDRPPRSGPPRSGPRRPPRDR